LIPSFRKAVIVNRHQQQRFAGRFESGDQKRFAETRPATEYSDWPSFFPPWLEGTDYSRPAKIRGCVELPHLVSRLAIQNATASMNVCKYGNPWDPTTGFRVGQPSVDARTTPCAESAKAPITA